MKINPVLNQGLRARMRGARALILIVVYLSIVLAMFSTGYISKQPQVNSYSGSGYSYSITSMASLFLSLAIIEFALIFLVVPAMNAGAISGERERQTLDLLLCSRLSSIRLVFGKILSNFLFSVFLIVLTMPFFAIAYLEGGLQLIDIAKLFGFYCIMIYLISSIAVFFSALFKKTALANICTYVFLLVFIAGTIAVGSWQLSNMMTAEASVPQIQATVVTMPFLLRINPIILLFSVIDPMNQLSSVLGLFGASFVASSLWIPIITYIVIALIINVLSAIIVNPVKKIMIF